MGTLKKMVVEKVEVFGSQNNEISIEVGKGDYFILFYV